MKANLALSNIKKQQGQWQKAYQYHLRFIELSDSILNSETQKKISDYQWEMESQKKKYEREVLQKKYEIQKRNNIFLAISIISVIIITLVVSRNLKKSIKQQKLENTHLQEKINITKKINELEKFKYKAEIEAKDKELTILSLQLVTKNEILTDISEMTNKLYKTNMMDAISFNNLKKIIKENLNLDKDWDQFKKMFENVHQIFFTKLKQTCPELTENEMRLCAYLKVNLQNREIAKILNVSQATIATNRYHIRKKLNLDKKTSLENYIREI
jgi:DNA-binding CsgD family transcriptional regulator